MNWLLRTAFFAFAVLSLPAAALEQDVTSLALVDKIVQAYGGAAAIERITAVNAQGDIIALMRGAHGSYQRWFARTRMLRVETAYPNSSEIRILSGERTWSSNSGGLTRAVSGPGHLAMIYQYKQLDLPYGLLKGRYNLRHLGREELAGQETEVIEVWDDEGPSMRVNVDTASRYIVKVTGYLFVAGSSTSLAAEFSDFRPIEGMPMPFRIRNYAGGAPISETTIRRYSVNPETTPSLFGPPIDGLDVTLLPIDTMLAGSFDSIS